MKLIVPYTEKMQPIVKELLQDIYKLNPDFQYVGDGDNSYWALLVRLWKEGETFVIVEHDVLPWPGCVEELYGCPFQWCSCSYKISISRTGKQGYGISHAFGCTKFSKHLIEQLPDVWATFESRHWKHLDAQFYTQATAIDQCPHPHRPPVIHLP